MVIKWHLRGKSINYTHFKKLLGRKGHKGGLRYPPTDGLFLWWTDFFTDRLTDFLDGRIFAWMVSKQNLSGLLTDCQKKFSTNYFWHFFGQILGKVLAIFGNLWAILGQNRAFPLVFFLFLFLFPQSAIADGFAAQTVSA